jgi:hypothetical protein
MASSQKEDTVGKRIQKEMREMRKKYKDQGFDEMEIEALMRDFFVEKKTPAKKAMTAAKGGMAKKKKMARGGVAKKKMRGGGMVKAAAKKKKMMRGGMAKKKK